jgi:hypothetical protein
MIHRTPRSAYALSTVIALLAVAASLTGLLGGVYRDNAWITAAFRGTDLVTLVLAVPLLLGGQVLSRRGSTRGHLVWLAMLGYMLYGYAFYLFGASFNALFLVYTALFGLSIWALVLAAGSTDAAAFVARIRPGMPRWPVVTYLVVVACGLGILWVAMSAGFVFTGQVPAPVVNSGHPTGVVFALDLSLIVPGMIVAGMWLLKKRPWGYLLGGFYAVKGTVYTVALISSTVFAMQAQVEGAGAELPVWIVLTVLGAVASGTLLANLADDQAP